MDTKTPQTSKRLVRISFPMGCPDKRQALTLSNAFSASADIYKSSPFIENEKAMWMAADRFRCEPGHRTQLRREGTAA